MDKLKGMITRKLEIAQVQIDEFKVKLDEDAAYALMWSKTIFQAAAMESVCKSILAAIDKGTLNLDYLKATLTDQVLHAAKYPAESTSPTSNLMDNYMTAVKAEILSDLEYL